MVKIAIEMGDDGAVTFAVDGDISVMAMLGLLEIVKTTVLTERPAPVHPARSPLLVPNGSPVPRLRG